MIRLFRRRIDEQELDDELAFHLEELVNRHVAAGLSHAEAMRRARLELGGFDQVKEAHMDARGGRLLDDLRNDLRYAGRQITRSPGFAALAVLCLGLGIGANTSIFTALNSVLLRPLAGADPGRLVRLSRGTSASFSQPDFKDLQARSRLSGLTASFPMESDLEVDGVSEFVAAEVVAANYGAVLGIAPALGSWFTSDTELVAVISYAVWQSRFGGSASVLGRRIGSEAQSYRVVGVAPRAFTGTFGPFRTDIWVPMRTRPRLASMLEDRSRPLVMVFGRLHPGSTMAQASAELNVIQRQLVAENGVQPTDPLAPIVAEPIRGIPNPGGRRLVALSASLLMIVVGVVLLIACVNVANLLLVRGSLRRRELAVRQALGATRSRLMRQLLTESLVLAIGGGTCGLLLAVWTTRLLERVTPSMRSAFPIDLNLSLDWRVIAFTTILSVATTVVCGLVPAWRGSRTSAVAGFKGDIGGTIRRRRPFGLVAQVALSFVLLLFAGNVIETLRQLQVTDPGFAVSGRLYAYIYFPSQSTPEAGRQLYAQTLDRLRALPGVLSASQTSTLPLMPSGSDCVSLPGGPQLHASTSDIDLGYFHTVGIRMTAGRDFTSIDLRREASTIVITESLAKRLWPSRSPIGERALIGCQSSQPSVVIGVVRDSAVQDVGEAPEPRFYRPFAREYSGGLSAILLEIGSDPAAMVPSVRETLLGTGHNIRVYAVQPLRTYIDQSFTGVRWMAMALSGFGLLALLLAAIGLYGVIAYWVSLRTQEIGVRMALGAGRGAIFREVVLHGLMIAVAGVVIGEVLAIPAIRALASVQAGIRPGDPSIHFASAVVWVVVAVVACYVPASRASRVDPMEALRHE